MKQLILSIFAVVLLSGCPLEGSPPKILHSDVVELTFKGVHSATCIRCSSTRWAQFEFRNNVVYSIKVENCSEFTMPQGYKIPATRIVRDDRVVYEAEAPIEIWKNFCF